MKKEPVAYMYKIMYMYLNFTFKFFEDGSLDSLLHSPQSMD